MEYTEHIKVNLPNDEDSAKTGNGEGCWVLVTKEVKKLHDEDVTGGIYEGKLDNNSCYYPNLKAGEIIRFEMKGVNRPLAIYEDLQAFRPKDYDLRKEVGLC